MKKIVTISTLCLIAISCMPGANMPSVLEPIDSQKWKQCADELAKREQGALLDDLTLDSATLVCQGAVLASEGKTNEALELLTEASVKDKEDHRPHYLAGRVLADAGRYDEALTAFERSHQRFPSMEVPTERMGRSIEKKSGPEEALGFMKRANDRGLCPYGCQGLMAKLHHQLKQDDEARKIYKEMTGIKPGEPTGYVGLASLANAESDFIDETTLLERAISVAHFKDLSDIQKADIYFSLAFAKYNSQNLAGAKNAIETALELNPKRADWYLLEGWIALKEGQAAKAIIAFDTAKELDPNMAAVHAGIGDAELALGNVPGARTAYSRAKEIDPTNGVYALKGAHAAAMARDFEIAEKLLNDAKAMGADGLPQDLVRKVVDLLPAKVPPTQVTGSAQAADTPPQ